MPGFLQICIAKYKSYPYIFILCSAMLFCQKTAAVNYYVNDSSLIGDLYTKAMGNDTNDGLSPNFPKRTLLAAYANAKEGDVIYVDTGNYDEITVDGTILLQNEKKIQFIVAPKSDGIHTKAPFPDNQKVSPEIFYIQNDKPVSQETYLKRLQSNSKEK